MRLRNLNWLVPLQALVVLAVYPFAMVECTGGSSSTTEAVRHVLVEGIQLPAEKTLSLTPSASQVTNHDSNNHSLRLNGAGVRSIRMLGWEFKVYVAGFYTSIPLDSPESVYQAVEENSSHVTPMQMDFTFLRSVSQNRVTDAWTQQTEHSVEYTYPGYESDRTYFINCFGPIQTGGTETVQLLADGRTVIIDQGVQKGVIDSPNFQKSFLSMWFGSKAVATDLKAGLLGEIHHFGLPPLQHRHHNDGNHHHPRHRSDVALNMVGETRDVKPASQKQTITTEDADILFDVLA